MLQSGLAVRLRSRDRVSISYSVGKVTRLPEPVRSELEAADGHLIPDPGRISILTERLVVELFSCRCVSIEWSE